MSKALLINLLLASAPAGDLPPATLGCAPPDRPLAELVCASTRLSERDKRVGAGVRIIIDSSLSEAVLARIGIESDRLRVRRDACTGRNVAADGREACLIYAYDRWLERLEEWQGLARAARRPSLTDPVEPPDVAAR